MNLAVNQRFLLSLYLQLLLPLSFYGAARAVDASDEAEAAIRKGLELRHAGNDDAAAQEFKRAYQLKPTPRSAAQLGLAEQALGLWEDAEAHLGEACGALDDPWLAKHRAVLLEALREIKQHVGRIEVIAEPDGAEVLVNGKSAGKTPLANPVHVRVGVAAIEVRHAGYVGDSRTLTIAGGQYQNVVIRLVKEGVAPAGPAAAPVSHRTEGSSSASVGLSSPLSGDGANTVEPGVSESHVLRNIAIGTGSAGVAAIGLGIYFGLRARSLDRQVREAPTFDPGADADGQRAHTTQWIMDGVGVALLAGAGVVYMVQLNKTHHGAVLSVTPAVGTTFAGAIATGRF